MDASEDLEALLKLSLAEATKRRAAGTRPSVAPASTERHRLAFTDPKNWSLTSHVQLVHRADKIETLLGVFAEYHHIHSKGTRKLVAVQLTGEMKPRIEYVTGEHWLAGRLESKAAPALNTVEIVEDLYLDMGVSAPAVMVKVSLLSGGVSRVCLAATTTFQGYAPRTFLTVAEGVDVLECLSRSSKERIWDEIKKETDGA